MQTVTALVYIVITATICAAVIGGGVVFTFWWFDCGDRHTRAVAGFSAGLCALMVTALVLVGLTRDNGDDAPTRPSAPATVDVDGGVN